MSSFRNTCDQVSRQQLTQLMAHVKQKTEEIFYFYHVSYSEILLLFSSYGTSLMFCKYNHLGIKKTPLRF